MSGNVKSFLAIASPLLLPLLFLFVIPEGDLLLLLFVLARHSERSEEPLYFAWAATNAQRIDALI
jgi:hypothetical protein